MFKPQSDLNLGSEKPQDQMPKHVSERATEAPTSND